MWKTMIFNDIFKLIYYCTPVYTSSPHPWTLTAADWFGIPHRIRTM